MLSKSKPESRQSISILIVGSAPAETLQVFADSEIQIVTSQSAEEAWEVLQEQRIALTIANIENGAEFLSSLRQKHQLCSRVLCVPSQEKADVIGAIKLGRPHYILSNIAELEESAPMIIGLAVESFSHFGSLPLPSSGPGGFRDSLRTPVPTLHDELHTLVQTLETDQHLACLYIDLSRLRPIEREFGIALHSDLFTRAGSVLNNLRGTKLRQDDLICRTGDSDAYICFTGPSRYGEYESVNHETLAARLNEHLNEELANAMRGLTSILPQVTIGAARILENPMIRGERLVMRLVSEARAAAELSWQANRRVRKSELQDLIIKRELRPVFQPIVDMDSAETFAFEALIRGPRETILESPTELFSVAEAVDLTLELDRACFRAALRAAKGCEPIHRLFVNLLPQSFHDERFIAEEVYSLLENASLTPANLVFEITEKLAIANFSAFKQALGRYTDMGFGVAVDDVGTQHSNLESLIALQPHFIKLSDVLCRGVAHSMVKREMVRSLQRIAETIDAVTVAEGIEDIEDFRALRDLGIRFGQGFYLCRPQEGFQKVDEQAKSDVRELAPRVAHGVLGTPMPNDDFHEPTIPRYSFERGITNIGWEPSVPREDRSQSAETATSAAVAALVDAKGLVEDK